MSVQLHQLKTDKAARPTKRRVGRGNASGRGTYSSRGLKGQRARSGGKKGLKLKGFKANLLNLPKFKGNKSIRPNNQVVSFDSLNKAFKDGDKVTPEVLEKVGLIEAAKVPVKILNNGALSVKIEVEGCKVSRNAKQSIEKAGGKVKEVQSEKPKIQKKEAGDEAQNSKSKAQKKETKNNSEK